MNNSVSTNTTNDMNHLDVSATPNNYTLPELTYDYSALEPLYSGEALELHHTKHHAAYVNGINKTQSDLWEARSQHDYDSLNMLQKNLAFHLSGHVLHSLFWRNLSPNGGGEPPDDLARPLNRAFEGVHLFREQFSNAALSLQGSGWAALSWEPIGSSLVVEQVYDHQGNTGNGTVPLLVLDMWEHAYYLQHQANKQRWIDDFWEMVNWTDVSERLDRVASLDLRV